MKLYHAAHYAKRPDQMLSTRLILAVRPALAMLFPPYLMC